jgi:hypothetical protein
MLWEAYQQTKIVGAQHAADRAVSKVERHSDDIKKLKRDVARLTLACQSMWKLLRDNTGFDEAQLEAKILEVDMRDGSADGEIGMRQAECPACRKKTNSRREICLMCGAPLGGGHIFE